MKKYVPLAISAAALAAALWWALSGLGEDEAAPSAGPALVPVAAVEAGQPRPGAKEPAPRVSEGLPPILRSRQTAPPPPKRIVPETESIPMETEPDPEPAADRPRREEEDDEKRGRPADYRQGSGRTGLLGGVARTNARATAEIRVPEGRARIGTSQGDVNRIRRSAPAGTYPGLQMEVPVHFVEIDEYFIDRFEVSNHRYWEYLNDSARVTYDTSDFEARTLVQIAAALVQPAPSNLDIAGVTARQLYETNKPALLAVFKREIVEDRDGSVDDEATWRRIRERTVPSGLRLTFYERPPPGTWPSDRYPEREPDRPVRDIALEEAIEYAMWAGRHVPTELEWEYAARGPKGSPFPWGPRATGFSSRVNGGSKLKRGERPRTAPFHHHPDGVSWIGCFNMLGNVSEWTTSFLDLYTGGRAPAGFPVGQNVVVRGGAAADQDRHLVRPAFRGWSGGDPDGPPLANMRRQWTGFRTARYKQVGRGRLPAMHYFARRGGHLHPDALLPFTYEAWRGRAFPGHERFFNPVDPALRPGTKTFVAQPLRAMTFKRPRPDDPVFTIHANHRTLTTPQANAASAGNPLFFGLFENGIRLVSTWQGTPDGPDALLRPGRFTRGDCPPGVWLVGLLHRQIVLVRPDLQQVFYVTTRGAPEALFALRERKAPKNPARSRSKVSLLFDRDSGRIDLGMELPLGPHGGEPFSYVARLRLRAQADLRDVVHVREWRKGRLR